MSIVRSTTLAVVASGLLAACASAQSSSIVPAGAPPAEASLQTQSDAKLSPGRAHPRRVLYVANIDGQPGVGNILVYTAGMKNPKLLRTISNGTGRPFGLWVDAKNILYVANQADKYPASVTEFKPEASSPFFTITNFKGYPGSVAVDADQNVWVNESVQDEGYVQEFTPGTNTAKATIDTGVGGYAFDPGSMAFDPQGDLLVAEQAKLQLQIVKLAPGSSQFVPVNLDLKNNNIIGPGMGIDKAGNIYVASSEAGTISVFAPGLSEPSRTISPIAGYGLTAVTPQGAVYQASGEFSVDEVAPGSNGPTDAFDCECSAQGVAVSR